MTKLNISQETINKAKAIKINSNNNKKPVDILTENWEKLDKSELEQRFTQINWSEAFEGRDISEEAISMFLDIAIPYLERFKDGRFKKYKRSSYEYKSQGYIYECVCQCVIPKKYWAKILNLTDLIIDAFYSWQPIDEDEIVHLIELGFKADMDAILFHHEMSEEFMEKYADKLDWDIVSITQSFSEEFLMKHLDKLNLIEIEKRIDI